MWCLGMNKIRHHMTQVITPPSSLMAGGPQMMGLGKGNSPFKHGNFLVSMLDFKPTTLDTYCLSHHQDCRTFFQFKGWGPQINTFEFGIAFLYFQNQRPSNIAIGNCSKIHSKSLWHFSIIFGDSQQDGSLNDGPTWLSRQKKELNLM